MIRFVENANLPINAGTVILGERYCALLEDKLNKLSIQVLPLPDNYHVDKRLAGHADLSILHLGGADIYLAPYLAGSKFHDKLFELSFKITIPDIIQTQYYPNDAQLNICIFGDKIIGNSRLKHNINDHMKFIDTRQGYSKCCVCVVDSNSIITSDMGVARNAHRAGVDVLHVPEGFIDLPGYDYGFIGGAAFKVTSECIAFTGTLDKHPAKKEIFSFLFSKNVEPLFLSKHNIFDVGSILPIMEKYP